MFARRTSARMRGSTVVQGLKSLLYPQLPLSPKESQRLLTALTTSFRKQLDEAHPRQAGLEERSERSPAADASGTTGAKSIHSSSAALADRHLASVLTNPLLAKVDAVKKPVLDYDTAKIEMQKASSRDPISLLEEYYEKGAATIPIAVLCLEKFKQTVDRLPDKERRDLVMETKAGQRVLLWLWNSKLYETDAFVDDFSLYDTMVPFVIEEGAEKYLWYWWQMDLGFGTLRLPKKVPNRWTYQYRWKGRMLRAMVQAKLEQIRNMSADDALDTFFKACDLRESAIKRGEASYLYPLGPASVCLRNAFIQSPGSFGNTDSARFERLIKSGPLSAGHDNPPAAFQRANLWLSHPKDPSPFPSLDLLKSVFLDQLPDDSTSPLLTDLRREETKASRYYFMIRTAAQLKAYGHQDEADWVISIIRQYSPERSPSVARDIKKERVPPRHSIIQKRSDETDAIAPQHYPYAAAT